MTSAQTTEHPLSTMFAPTSIAIIGASEKSPWTAFILKTLKDFEFSGRAFAINRNGVDVGGLRGAKSCRDLDEPVDVVFVTVPQSVVLDSLEDAAAAGVRNAVILTSGYAEIGPEGAAHQQELIERAADWDMKIWGPNSLGFNNVSANVPISAIPAMLPLLEPSIAIVSQSGATASELNDLAHSQNIGTSFVAATGNEVQLTLADVVDYLVDHEPTKGIAIFAESIRDPLKFERAVTRARAARKPVVILKIGRSELAAQVAKAHTGSLAGDDKVFDAICERLGIVRVFSPEDLIATCGLLAATGPLSEPGISFISISGGACTLVADGAEAAGVTLPEFQGDTVAALQGEIADFASSMNPLDVTGAAMRDPTLFERLIPIAASAPGVGLVVVNMGLPYAPGQAELPGVLTAIGKAARDSDNPIVMATLSSKSLTEISRDSIRRHDLPHVVCGVDTMLRAAGRAAWWSKRMREPAGSVLSGREEIRPAKRPDLSSERAVLDYLASHGVPVIPAQIVQSREEAVAVDMEGPFVLKVLSPDIQHKTEVGGVRLDVAQEELGESYDGIVRSVRGARPDAQIDGIIISPMRRGGTELLVGVTRDPNWGPMLTAGFGGVLVELLADIALAPLPVTRGQVLNMLGGLRGAQLLKGYRNSAPADLETVADVIVRVGDAALALGPELDSLEVNPLLVHASKVEALDGLAIWKE